MATVTSHVAMVRARVSSGSSAPIEWASARASSAFSSACAVSTARRTRACSVRTRARSEVGAPTAESASSLRDRARSRVSVSPEPVIESHPSSGNRGPLSTRAAASRPRYAPPMPTPVRVAVTGAAGQIGYSLLPRIASGQLLGPDQPVILQLLEITPALGALEGVAMELDDCAFPLLAGIVRSDDADVAFGDADYALLVGAMPRKQGMERSDLLAANGAIFTAQGAALSRSASRDVRVLVVGNPANTNALIALGSAADLDPRQITAMTRLDHNRAVSQLAQRVGASVSSVRRMTIWGNHSTTQYPDLFHCEVDGRNAYELVGDHAWVEDTFIPTVAKRGAAIIEARGASSAASAAERRDRSRARLGARDGRGRLGQHGRRLRRLLRRARRARSPRSRSRARAVAGRSCRGSRSTTSRERASMRARPSWPTSATPCASSA